METIILFLFKFSIFSSSIVRNYCHASRNPVNLRIEFLTWLKSRPFNVLPFPVHTKNAIFAATLLFTISCGGVISSFSASSSADPHCRQPVLSGILIDIEFAALRRQFSLSLCGGGAISITQSWAARWLRFGNETVEGWGFIYKRTGTGKGSWEG